MIKPDRLPQAFCSHNTVSVFWVSFFLLFIPLLSRPEYKLAGSLPLDTVLQVVLLYDAQA
jgi:hypothetical protein